MDISSIRTPADRQVRIAWLVLVGCTLVSWTGSEEGHPSRWLTLAVLALAAVKVVVIIGSYMEISRAPRWLQALCGTWVTLVFATVAGIYWTGSL